MVQGVEVTLKTAFADGKAVNAMTEGSNATEKTDAVSADAVVLPNVFFGSYAALAARLQRAAVGTEMPAYIAPQAEISRRGHRDCRRADRDAQSAPSRPSATR